MQSGFTFDATEVLCSLPTFRMHPCEKKGFYPYPILQKPHFIALFLTLRITCFPSFPWAKISTGDAVSLVLVLPPQSLDSVFPSLNGAAEVGGLAGEHHRTSKNAMQSGSLTLTLMLVVQTALPIPASNPSSRTPATSPTKHLRDSIDCFRASRSIRPRPIWIIRTVALNARAPQKT